MVVHTTATHLHVGVRVGLDYVCRGLGTALRVAYRKVDTAAPSGEHASSHQANARVSAGHHGHLCADGTDTARAAADQDHVAHLAGQVSPFTFSYSCRFGD